LTNVCAQFLQQNSELGIEQVQACTG